MARPRRIDRPTERKLSLPESLVTKVELELFSTVENRVPYGAWSELIQSLLRDWLERRGDSRKSTADIFKEFEAATSTKEI